MEIKLFIAGCILFVVAMFMQVIKVFFTTPVSQSVFRTVYSWVDTLWTALIIAAILMFFFIQAFKIPSGSMRNTFLEGDHLFVNKFIYGFHVPLSDGKRILALRKVSAGDIVVFKCPPEALTVAEREAGVKKDYIKRCVAVGGDKVEIKDKKLYVNGILRSESYVKFEDQSVFQSFSLFPTEAEYQKSWETGKLASVPTNFVRDNFGPVVVPAGHYMMLGDNRDYSFDSRFWGPLPDKYIKGKALIIYWPVKRIRII
ncbi:MAG: signal peptidase I [Endomicrobia bacterium]|nr:signal peptidase I [Endomicrobiia bacterium]MCL2507235.1 signal peptidase I [Endomicrobiia bacterium]